MCTARQSLHSKFKLTGESKASLRLLLIRPRGAQCSKGSDGGSLTIERHVMFSDRQLPFFFGHVVNK